MKNPGERGRRPRRNWHDTEVWERYTDINLRGIHRLTGERSRRPRRGANIEL